MSNIDLKHLFTPGTGAIPPYLAGRKREQEYFRDCIEALTAQKPISQDMIVYGPRGNGKTALLRYLQKETRQKEKEALDVMWAKPYELETRAGLENLALGHARKLRDKVKTVELSASIGGVVGASVGLDYSGPAATLESLLRSRSQIKPLILIVDEAHTLEPDVGKVLLNISQDLRTEGKPFLLILAGTPNLEATLSRTNASFWDRSELFPLGHLSPDEAGQAITEPFKALGISLASGATEEIVDRTHCYPFFLQVWGNCLARRLIQTGATEVTLDTVREVEAEADRKRNLMYQRRYNEIDRMGLLPVAESVAGAFAPLTEPVLRTNALKDAIAAALSGPEPVTHERIMNKLVQLFQLGYVWQTDGANYEPGIPSLMAFVQEYARQAGDHPRAIHGRRD